MARIQTHLLEVLLVACHLQAHCSVPPRQSILVARVPFAMDPAKIFHGASRINLLLQNPEMHVVLFEMKRMSLTRLLLCIEGLAVL